LAYAVADMLLTSGDTPCRAAVLAVSVGIAGQCHVTRNCRRPGAAIRAPSFRAKARRAAVEESPSSGPNGSLSGRLRFLDSLRSLGMTLRERSESRDPGHCEPKPPRARRFLRSMTQIPRFARDDPLRSPQDANATPIVSRNRDNAFDRICDTRDSVNPRISAISCSLSSSK